MVRSTGVGYEKFWPVPPCIILEKEIQGGKWLTWVYLENSHYDRVCICVYLCILGQAVAVRLSSL